MTLTPAVIHSFNAFQCKRWERAAFACCTHWDALSVKFVLSVFSAARVGSGSNMLDAATGAG